MTTVGIVGTILSTFTIYCLIRHVKLPYRQVKSHFHFHFGTVSVQISISNYKGLSFEHSVRFLDSNQINPQNLFILNVTVGDVVIALLGLVRGLGIISPIFVGYNSQTQKQNWWCATYTFIGNTLWLGLIKPFL